ncbi:MAG: DUF222 domain-containing protein [Acidimicrobiaceae bacterium]|nr:DUF222 domain-containing protein [Acidimicrobiaceae bacterium]
MLRDGANGAKRANRLSQPDHLEPLSLPRLRAEALAGLGRDELTGVLGDIEQLANRLAGYRAEVLGALEVLNQTGEVPDWTPYLTLRDAAGVSERDARQMVRAAEKARSNEALSEGDINPAQAETLCDARVPDAVRAGLVAAAAGEDTDATRRRVRQAETDHCVETPTERFERQRQARGAGWRRDHEGMLRLWAKFDPETGAHVEAQLEMLRREYWNDDKQVPKGRRSPAQRDADVLAYALAGITLTDADAESVGRLHARARRNRHVEDVPTPSRRTTPRKGAAAPVRAGRGQPGCASPGAQMAGDEGPAIGRRLPPAQISVLIGLDALRCQTDESGLTDAGTELPPEIVRRLACDAEVIPMILGGPGGPADVGRIRRTVPKRLRRLLVARDRHCRWPGCHEPASRCDAHHIIHWLDGGPTDLDNLVLLCHRHHHHLHQHGYKMVPQPDGTWTAAQEAEPTATPQRTPRQPRGP